MCLGGDRVGIAGHPGSKCGSDRGRVDRRVVQERAPDSLGDRGGRDPVAPFPGAAARPIGVRRPSRPRARSADQLAGVAGGDPVVVEVAHHAAGVAGVHETQDGAVERLVEIRVLRARRVPETAGARGYRSDAEAACDPFVEESPVLVGITGASVLGQVGSAFRAARVSGDACPADAAPRIYSNRHFGCSVSRPRSGSSVIVKRDRNVLPRIPSPGPAPSWTTATTLVASTSPTRTD